MINRIAPIEEKIDADLIEKDLEEDNMNISNPEQFCKVCGEDPCICDVELEDEDEDLGTKDIDL